MGLELAPAMAEMEAYFAAADLPDVARAPALSLRR
jgi:hypothetical protein